MISNLNGSDSVQVHQKKAVFTGLRFDSLTLRHQQENESVDAYLQALKSLSYDCQYSQVDASTHKNEAIRGAFIAGLSSTNVKLRLRENEHTDLDSLVQLARSLEIASDNASKFLIHTSSSGPVINKDRTGPLADQ